MTSSPEAPRRLRRAEAVLRRRTSRLLLVMERPWNHENAQAVLRTAESFGVQHVWTVRHPHGRQRVLKMVTKGSHRWLSRRIFTESAECVAALRESGYEIWATDLGPGATVVCSHEDLGPIPDKVAIVIGREIDGVSEEFLDVAERRLFLPMQGFTESLNLSVATALLLQRCFDADPSLVGAMPEDERAALRAEWFTRLAGGREEKLAAFAPWIESPPEPLEDLRPTGELRRPRMRERVRKWMATPGE